MHHYLIWDIPDDPRIPHILGKRHGDFRIYPLTYAGLCTSRKLFPGNLTDFGDVIDAQRRVDLQHQSLVITNSFFEAITLCPFDWLPCLYPYILQQKIYYFVLGKAFCETIQEKFGPDLIRQFPFWAPTLSPPLQRRMHELFELSVDAHNAVNNQPSSPFRKSLFRTVAGIMASLSAPVIRRSNKLVASPEKHRDRRRQDILLLALEESDRRIQGNIVKKLLDHEEITLRWLTASENRMEFSSDEASLDEVSSLDRFVDLVGYKIDEGYSYRFPYYRHLAKWGAKKEIAKALESAFAKAGIVNANLEPFANHITEGTGGLPLLHAAASDLLSQYEPRITCINSSHGPTRVLQVVAAQKKWMVARLPHGIEDAYGLEISQSEAILARFGQHDVRILRERYPHRASSFKSIGGLHLGIMGQTIKAGMQGVDGCGQIKILYPVTIPVPFMPVTPAELEDDVFNIAQAAARVNARLVVRGHPRHREHNFYDYELMRKQSAQAGWTFSDGQGSMCEQLNESSAVIIQHWSGAGLLALYSNKPLIVWHPRPYIKYFDEFVLSFPAVAHSADQLSCLLSKVVYDESYCEELVRIQKEILAGYVQDPQDDPYEGAVSLFLNELNAGKQSARQFQ